MRRRLRETNIRISRPIVAHAREGRWENCSMFTEIATRTSPASAAEAPAAERKKLVHTGESYSRRYKRRPRCQASLIKRIKGEKIIFAFYSPCALFSPRKDFNSCPTRACMPRCPSAIEHERLGFPSPCAANAMGSAPADVESLWLRKGEKAGIS
jgi:hypothetical protein